MAIRCPGCGREFDITLFEFGREVICTCGRRITLQHREEIADYPDIASLEEEIFRETGRREDREGMEKIGREADRITIQILYSDLPMVDVEIAIRSFREKVIRRFPAKLELFDGLYLSRFRRLWQQFRDADETLLEEENS